MKRTLLAWSLAGALALAVFAGTSGAQPVVYHFGGDAVPTAAPYGDMFTTIGANSFGSFPATSWSSDGEVLAMNTVYPGNGIWFGRYVGNGYDSRQTMSFAGTGDGNVVSARLALGANSTEWSLYWYDASGYGSSFYLETNRVSFYYRDATSGSSVTQTLLLGDLTSFHTFTSYVLGGQVSYFMDGSYLGGGAALTGATNFLLLGDGSGSTPTGRGTLFVDYLTVTAAPLSFPSVIPEPSTYGLMIGGLMLSMVVWRRRSRA